MLSTIKELEILEELNTTLNVTQQELLLPVLTEKRTYIANLKEQAKNFKELLKEFGED